jgi:hypothetical protein
MLLQVQVARDFLYLVMEFQHHQLLLELIIVMHVILFAAGSVLQFSVIILQSL